MLITKQSISRAIGNETRFQGGVSYFSARKVTSVELVGNVLKGSVLGNGGNLFHVQANVYADSSGLMSAVHGMCTCDVGYNCKHLAAVLLECAQRSADHAPAASATPGGSAPALPGFAQVELPGEIMSWLDRLDEGKRASPTKTAPKSSGDAVFYVFRRSHDNARAEIAPFQAYVKKDGGIGKSVREFNPQVFGINQAGATQSDAVILAQLAYFSTDSYPTRQDLPSGETLERLLQQVIATGRARFRDIHGPSLAWAESREVSFEWTLDAVGDQGLQARDADGRSLVVLPFPDPVFVDESSGLTGLALTSLPPGVAAALASAPTVPAESVTPVAEHLERRLGVAVPRPDPVAVHERADLAPSMSLKLFGHSRKQKVRGIWWSPGSRTGQETVTYPCIRAEIRYEGCSERLEPASGPDIRHADKKGVHVIRRDRAAEMDLLFELEGIAAEFDGEPPEYAHLFGGRLPRVMREAHVIFPHVVPGDMDTLQEVLEFNAEGLPLLRELGWEIDIDPSWPARLHSGDVSFQTVFEQSDNDWFSLALKLDVDGTALDLTNTILQLVASLPLDDVGNLVEGFDLDDFLADFAFHLNLPDGTMVPVQGVDLAGFIEAFLEAHGLTRFHMADAGRAARLVEALDGCGAPWDGGTEILELGKRLRILAAASGEDQPASLKAELRPYQTQGYGWLKALSESGFGGILADDMGLGKTVQALSLLLHCHVEGKAEHPSLLVIPTSLVSNWLNEAARFAPDLKVLCLHGSKRHQRFDQIGTHDLVLTTYPLIHRDHEALFAHEYELAILDEAQAVKNPAASVARHIRQIKARQRIALTGTPLENNLTELWALFDWLIPGFLGDRKGFGAEYRKPIEQRGDRARQRLLSDRVKPFLLRRTKDEVVEDLPPKTVIDESVALTGEQALLYESVRGAMDARVRAAVAERGLSGSRITVLDALLKLRQVCCDPRLVKLDAAAKVKESAKRDRLLEILEELVSENRKVLVFSQFVEMLRLIETDVRNRGWLYAMLHGQTRDRAAAIERFQSGDAQLFLISLKAGGTGLNLTAADTVVLYDPWWNPAVERQAMDRAHRIGQDKPVFVYRLYSENTVETAIKAMQAQKQALADALFEGTGGGALTLTEDDLANLFGAT